jgi:hypothetical protein
MTDEKPRIDLSEVFRSYSRKLLFEYREGAKALPKHGYDRGAGREEAVRDFLMKRLPGRYGVGEGIVIDAHGGQSKQCDVVIYDRERTPELSTEQSLNFWPYESVYGIVQVKSLLTRAALDDAVANIAAFKRLKREENVLVGGPGFVSNVGKQNYAIGMLIAHETDVAPGTSEFSKIVASVPIAEQIDVYCVISGPVGCRGTRAPGQGLLLGSFAELGTDLFNFEFGDGALAFFLMVSTAILNSIQLGNVNWIHYMRFLTGKTALGHDPQTGQQ